MATTAMEPRFEKRIPCAIRDRGAERNGLVLNVSRSGLFMQTAVPAQAGGTFDVELNPAGKQAPIRLRAKVVWRKNVPASLRGVAKGGLGMQIVWAPEEYYGMLSDLMDDPATLNRPAPRWDT